MKNNYPNRPCDNNIRQWFPHEMESVGSIVERVMEKLKEKIIEEETY